VALTPRARGGASLALAFVFLLALWSGMARPGSVTAPAGDAGLCLALTAWRAGAGTALSFLLWSAGLVLSAACSGVAPIWPALAGWPAWLLLKALAGGRGFPAFLGLAVALLTLCRCAGKLLLLALPGGPSPLTLSGASLWGSLLAEALPNLLCLLLFAALLGERRR
jgi:hypothetical protein